MGTKERRAREKEELREKILDAARELFVERGYEAVTMRQIAEAIEYSPTAIYLHFEDKLALVRSLCDRDFSALGKRFQKIAAIADPVERLRRSGQAYAEFALRNPQQYRYMFLTPHPPIDPADSKIDRDNPREDAYAFLRWTVSEAIAAGRLRPGLDDPELVSQIVWAGVHGIVSLRITNNSDKWVAWRSEKKTVEAMIETLLRGLVRGEG
jgi:AcrR family transcriptional regulator